MTSKLAPSLLAVVFSLAGASCAQVPSISQIGAATDRSIVQSDGFRLEMNWCRVQSDRTAECELTATSLTQDFKAGFSYPILQDQSGAQYRMTPKDGSLGRYVMIAGEPYTVRYVNKEILPTTVERVRGVVGSWAYWTTGTNLKAGQFPISFSDIPEPVASRHPPLETTGSDAKNGWETVGFWTYDAQDGLRLPEGLILRAAPGAMGDHVWTHRLELKAHAKLPPRTDRILWPVFLNRSKQEVCVDAPYPTYSGYIDFAEDDDDGAYAFSSCPGGPPS
jgi:hypothetical protein